MSDHDVSLTVDGTAEDVTVEARRLLVHTLRDELGYTAPHVGCESGKCGACTVELDGRVVKSCCLLTVQADGGEITTVAGLTGDDASSVGGPSGADRLHPIQESFHEKHGLQCGFCTPGMVLTARELVADNPDPSREEIRHGLKGNVCRCTGYHNVVDAVESAAAKLSPIDVDGGRPDGGTGDSATNDGEEGA
jgi:carbon-monoxide dehydrogenase small subunit